MTTRRLADFDATPIALGGMPMSLAGRPDEAQAIRTIHAALDAGINVVDTADVYARDEADLGHNERLIAKALDGRRDGVVVATKGGMVRRGTSWGIDGRPEHLRAACEASLRVLRTDRIDLYQLHRPDADVPFAESVGALKQLRDEGKVRWVGLSNVTVAQLEEALTIVDVASVQNQLSPRYPFPLDKGEVAAAAARGIAFLPWSPLGGIGRAGDTALAPIRDAAARRDASVQQVTLAWLLALDPAVLPIVGASRPETILASLQAVDLTLDEDEVQAIARAAHDEVARTGASADDD